MTGVRSRHLRSVRGSPGHSPPAIGECVSESAVREAGLAFDKIVREVLTLLERERHG